jgi:glycine cleavage system aminomethyltransferase T
MKTAFRQAPLDCLDGSGIRSAAYPLNAPLFEAAVDMNKDYFVGKEALAEQIRNAEAKRCSSWFPKES